VNFQGAYHFMKVFRCATYRTFYQDLENKFYWWALCSPISWNG